MMKKILFALLALVGSAATLEAQELNFEVNVLTPHLQKVDRKVFDGLKVAVKEFINTQKWTDDVYDVQERLTGTITITITDELSLTSFKAEISINVNRPVYGAEYGSPLITHRDPDFTFTYEQYQPLLFTKNTYSDNLTSVLAYYVYSILGMDYDSFSLLGGEPYWQIAQDIFNATPNEVKDEWRGSGASNRSRYWISENMVSPRFKPFREAMYGYHRQGLDLASGNLEAVKAAVVDAVTKIDATNSAYPNSLAVRIFVNTKSQEMVDIMKGASPDQKTKFITVMTKIDPANANRYAQVGF